MDPQEEKLNKILAENVEAEIAERGMKPGLHAKALNDASGNKEKALAIYIKLRAEEMMREGIEAIRAAAADAVSRTTRGHRCKCEHFENMHPASKTWNTNDGRYFAPCSQCDCRDFTAWLVG